MRTDKLKIAILLILLSGVTVIAFLPSLKNGFVSWDDNDYVIDNNAIRALSPKNLAAIFSTVVSHNYHPLTILSYAIEYRFFGPDPLCYHITNLILHLLNCMLVFWLFLILSKKTPVAVITSVLFALHPMHVESVAWISERKDVLYAFFFLGSVILYIYYLKKDRQPKYYYASLGLFILSLLSKPMAVTLPFVLMLVDYFFRVKVDKITLSEKIPFFLLSLIFGAVAVVSQCQNRPILQNSVSDILTSFWTVNRGIGFYLYKLCVPLKFSCLYPCPVKTDDIFSSGLFAAPVLTMGLVIGLIFLSKKSRKAFFGAMFFVITISPVLQFVPAGMAIAADRYTYIPSIGIFYLIGELGLWLYTRKMRHNAILKVSGIVILIGVAAVLASLTRERCRIWRDGATLWSDVISQYPDCFVAYYNRGVGYRIAGDLDRALKDLDRTIAIAPDYYMAYWNRGLLHDSRGDLKAAISDYTKAIVIKPDFISAYNNRGGAYYDSKDFDKAIADYNATISLAPGYAKAYNDRAAAYFHKKEYDKSLHDVCKVRAMGYDPDPELVDRLKRAYGKANEKL